jgi:hypothetical protein
MKKYGIIALLCISQLTMLGYRQQEVSRTYGRMLGFGQEELATIQALLLLLEHAQSYQREGAIKKIIETLQQRLEELEDQKKKIVEQKTIIPRELYHTEFIHRIRLEHFKRLQEQQATVMPWYGVFSEYFRTTWERMRSWWYEEPYTSTEEQIAYLTDAYFIAEEKEILDNYKTVLDFFVLKQKMDLPQFLDVWGNPSIQQQLLLRTQRLALLPRIQMASFLEKAAQFGNTMLVQGAAFNAGSLALEETNKAFYKNMDTLNTQMTILSKDLETFNTQLQKDRTESFSTLINQFTQKVTDIDKEQEATVNRFKNELIYMDRSISDFSETSKFLSSITAGLLFDQLFEAAPMHTPGNRLIWYNPTWQLAHYPEDPMANGQILGDWEFDANTQSFWQQRLVPMPITLWQDATKGLDPSFNSIFTEYIPPKISAYDIALRLQLVACSWPFFAGIMFNKARWISGDPEGLTKYRLFGIYGTQTIKDDPTTRSLSLCFAQQKIEVIKDQTTGKITEKIISPLEQIMTGKAQVLFTFDQNNTTAQDSQHLSKNPQTYVITIQTLLDSINYTFSKQTEDPNQSTVEITNGRIDSLMLSLQNPDNNKSSSYTLFNYHGIGFMAPGCIAEFKITKPESLTYTPEELVDFKQSTT